jgi:hypothetical protein
MSLANYNQLPAAFLTGQVSLWNVIASPVIAATQQVAMLNIRTTKRFAAEYADAFRTVLLSNDYAKLVEVAEQYGPASSRLEQYKNSVEAIISESYQEGAIAPAQSEVLQAEAVEPSPPEAPADDYATATTATPSTEHTR